MTEQTHIAIPRPMLALVLACALTALVMQGSLSRVTVFIDGDRVAVAAGQTLDAALAQVALSPEPGDVVSALDGRVVGPRQGLPGHTELNGVVVAGEADLRPGDRITRVRGLDVVEPTLETTVAVPAPTVLRGEGARLAIIAEGRPGVERRVLGAVSRDVVETEMLTPPTPLILRRVNGDGTKLVALTFDDGPWPGTTDAILRVLSEKNATATFFMVGRYVKQWPDIAARVGDAGHLVGNHTFSHAVLTDIDDALLESELRWTNDLVEASTGSRPRWCRPPGGILDGAAYAVVERRGMRPVLWTVDPQDWGDGSADEIAGRVVAATGPGGVVLLHDGGGDRQQTVNALPMIIDTLRARGYEFVTLDELSAPKSRW